MSKNSKKNKSGKNSKVKIVINENVIKESEEYRRNNELAQNQVKNNSSSEPVNLPKEEKDNNPKTEPEPSSKENAPKTDTNKAEQGTPPANDKAQTNSKKPVQKTQRKDKKQNTVASEMEAGDKHSKLPVSVSLKDKSEQFKKLIDIALSIEKVIDESGKLRKKNKELIDEKSELKKSLDESKSLCTQKQNEIDKLKTEVEHREEVINIVKADKSESAQEFKNALGAALKTYRTDFEELKGMEMSNDVGLAIIETMDGVFKVLEKNGIIIK